MPAAGDLKSCPFLTISEPHESVLTDGKEDGEEWCTEPEDKGKSGWIEIYDSDNPGCGMFYDCCARVIPIACMEKLCMLFNSSSRSCSLDLGGGGGDDMPPEALYVMEWLYRRDMDDDGRIYGHEWVLENPPPCLQNIPPQINPLARV